jgi:hypothetical protein
MRLHGIALLVLSFLWMGSLQAQLATFTFKTVSEGGTFAPKHVLAVWIEKADGTFVRTLFLRANARKQYLYSWIGKSGSNASDATTGATLTQHTSHSIQWNCRDLSGSLMPDGDYKFVVEYTDKHAQGPKYELSFSKNAAGVNLSPANQAYFIDMSLVYHPTAVGIENYSDQGEIFDVSPNPSAGLFALHFQKLVLQSGWVEVFDAAGNQVFKQSISNSQMGQPLSLDLREHGAGVYFVRFRSQNQVAIRKIILLK